MTTRFLVYVLFSLVTICAAYYATFAVLLPAATQTLTNRLDDESKSFRRHGLSRTQAGRMFDPVYGRAQSDTVTETPGRADATAVSDSYASTALDGVLVPLSCSQVRRPCLTDRDCSTLCRGPIEYRCDDRQLVCSEPRVVGADGTIVDEATDDGTDDAAKPAVKCRTDAGEYAVLQGYTDQGTASWNCVQLFPGWEGGGTRYCEGGTVDMDTRKRLPSYKDCRCPDNTTRIVYAISRLGQQVYGLPHCVKDPKLFNIGQDFLAL